MSNNSAAPTRQGLSTLLVSPSVAISKARCWHAEGRSRVGGWASLASLRRYPLPRYWLAAPAAVDLPQFASAPGRRCVDGQTQGLLSPHLVREPVAAAWAGRHSASAARCGC